MQTENLISAGHLLTAQIPVDVTKLQGIPLQLAGLSGDAQQSIV